MTFLKIHFYLRFTKMREIINLKEKYFFSVVYNLIILMFIRTPRLSGQPSRIRIASSNLFKSHVIPRETKRLQRDSAHKNVKSREGMGKER